jgi:hypothetical protein
MVEKTPDFTDQNIYSAFLRLLNATSKVFVSLISLSAVAYLMGWIAAKSYFLQFGSEWIATQLSPIEIFSHALNPLYYFLISLFIMLSALDGDWPNPKLWETAIILVLCYVLLPIFFGGITKAAIIQQVIDYAPFGVGMLGAVILSSIVVHYSQKSNRSIPLLIYPLGIIAIWLLPTVTGAIQGRNDRDQNKSSLPQVVLKGNSSNTLRLLCLSQGHFYVFDDAVVPGEKSKVMVVSADEVSHLIGNENPKVK